MYERVCLINLFILNYSKHSKSFVMGFTLGGEKTVILFLNVVPLMCSKWYGVSDCLAKLWITAKCPFQTFSAARNVWETTTINSWPACSEKICRGSPLHVPVTAVTGGVQWSSCSPPWTGKWLLVGDAGFSVKMQEWYLLQGTEISTYLANPPASVI